MKKDQPTIDGIKWAAQFMLEHPGCTWVEMQQARPQGIKLWKGMMGVVKTYAATGVMAFPDKTKVEDVSPLPEEGTGIIPSLIRRVNDLGNQVQRLTQAFEKLGV